jgi:preprotein translocase subunit YajC
MSGLYCAAILPGGLLAQNGLFGPQCQQMLPALVLISAAFYFLVLRPQQKERQRREQMLKNLKKNDRVVTIGGIIGIVANVSPDNNEVTLKVDESTNTKLHVLRSSIHEVLKAEAPDAGAPKTP